VFLLTDEDLFEESFFTCVCTLFVLDCGSKSTGMKGEVFFYLCMNLSECSVCVRFVEDYKIVWLWREILLLCVFCIAFGGNGPCMASSSREFNGAERTRKWSRTDLWFTFYSLWLSLFFQIKLICV